MPAHSPAEIHTLIRDAFNLVDVEALIALYEPDAILVVGGEIVSGREGIREAYENSLLRRGRMTLETRSVIESPQGIAVLHGAWTVDRATEDGVTRGLSTEVVRRQSDGTWLFAIDNPFTPEQATASVRPVMG
jgi:uncharacterized protein (TIGR02246 family)